MTRLFFHQGSYVFLSFFLRRRESPGDFDNAIGLVSKALRRDQFLSRAWFREAVFRVRNVEQSFSRVKAEPTALFRVISERKPESISLNLSRITHGPRLWCDGDSRLILQITTRSKTRSGALAGEWRFRRRESSPRNFGRSRWNERGRTGPATRHGRARPAHFPR